MTPRTVDATLLIALYRISIEFILLLISLNNFPLPVKFIKHILSSVKKNALKGICTYSKAFFFCISTDFRKTMEGSIVLIAILKGSKLKRHVFKTTGANRF